jgi:hypothetical protein
LGFRGGCEQDGRAGRGRHVLRIVGDQKRRQLTATELVEHPSSRLSTCDGIKAAEGFVEEQSTRLRKQYSK